MAYIIKHMADCKKFLGEDFKEIHEFLDQEASIFNPMFFDDYHRTFLHNSYGVRLIKDKWGDSGYRASVLHLTRDWCNGTIDHWTLEGMIKEFPKRLMWFDGLHTNYAPPPHTVRGWNNISLVALSTL
jgi:hypothetical protein